MAFDISAEVCFKGFSALQLLPCKGVASDVRMWKQVLSSCFLHCDLSKCEKCLATCSPVHWSSYHVGSTAGNGIACTSKNWQQLHLLCLFPLKSHTSPRFPLWDTYYSCLKKWKRRAGKKGGRIAEASRNGWPRREESGGSVKGISAESIRKSRKSWSNLS